MVKLHTYHLSYNQLNEGPYMACMCSRGKYFLSSVLLFNNIVFIGVIIRLSWSLNFLISVLFLRSQFRRIPPHFIDGLTNCRFNHVDLSVCLYILELSYCFHTKRTLKTKSVFAKLVYLWRNLFRPFAKLTYKTMQNTWLSKVSFHGQTDGARLRGVHYPDYFISKLYLVLFSIRSSK